VPISPPVHIVAFSLLKIGYEDGSKITFRRKRLSLEKKRVEWVSYIVFSRLGLASRISVRSPFLYLAKKIQWDFVLSIIV